MKCPRCNGSGKIKAPASLGERLALLREHRGLSLREAVKAMGGKLSNANLHHIETGHVTNPGIHTIRILAAFYEVTLDDLISGTAIHSSTTSES